MAKNGRIHLAAYEVDIYKFNTFTCGHHFGKFTTDLDKVTCQNCKRTKKYKMQIQMIKCDAAIEAETGIVI